MLEPEVLPTFLSRCRQSCLQMLLPFGWVRVGFRIRASRLSQERWLYHNLLWSKIETTRKANDVVRSQGYEKNYSTFSTLLTSKRWATAMIVAPSKLFATASCRSLSVRESTLAVGSSRTRILLLRRMAVDEKHQMNWMIERTNWKRQQSKGKYGGIPRARQSSWRCPTLKFCPPSATVVSSRWGSCSMASSIDTSDNASSIWPSEYSYYITKKKIVRYTNTTYTTTAYTPKWYIQTHLEMDPDLPLKSNPRRARGSEGLQISHFAVCEVLIAKCQHHQSKYVRSLPPVIEEVIALVLICPRQSCPVQKPKNSWRVVEMVIALDFIETKIIRFQRLTAQQHQRESLHLFWTRDLSEKEATQNDTWHRDLEPQSRHWRANWRHHCHNCLKGQPHWANHGIR